MRQLSTESLFDHLGTRVGFFTQQCMAFRENLIDEWKSVLCGRDLRVIPRVLHMILSPSSGARVRYPYCAQVTVAHTLYPRVLASRFVSSGYFLLSEQKQVSLFLTTIYDRSAMIKLLLVHRNPPRCCQERVY